jgi:hypothetical protein
MADESILSVMKVRASIRLKGADAAQLPSGLHDQAAAAARALERHGIDVLHVGRRSVSIAAEPQQLEEALGVHVEANKVVAGAVRSEDRELEDLLDLVEVAPPPIAFAR